MVKFILQRVNEGKRFPLPKYATPQSSGIDLLAAIKSPQIIKPNEHKLIPSGLKIEMPIEYEGQIRSRSGIALNHGVIVLNSPGTIDSDFKGEIGIILINLSKIHFKIKPGMRIAQLVFNKIYRPLIQEGAVNNNDSKRKSGGFGSTGF